MNVSGAVMAVVLAVQGAGAPVDKGLDLAGTYGNVCVHPDSGDMLGIELFFPGAADPGHARLRHYEGAALAPERLVMGTRGAAVYLYASDGTAVMVVRRQGAALQVTHLTGSQASSGGDRETLVAVTRRGGDGTRPVCR